MESISVYGVREGSNFIDLHVAVQLSQHHLLKRLSLLHCIFLPPLLKINWQINSKWLKVWNIRHGTMKRLEENIGKTFSDVNRSNFFLGQSPKAIEN